MSLAGKWHYFNEQGRSLCGRWSDQEAHLHKSGSFSADGSDSCTVCYQKALKAFGS